MIDKQKGFWRIPKIWDKATCYILGGGPSLNDVDIDRLHGDGHRVIAVNKSFRLAEWADAMFFNDKGFFLGNRQRLLDFPGLKVSTCKAIINNAPGIKFVRRRNTPWGLMRDPGFIGWNESSGAAAINLAMHLGATKLILFGYDMKRIGDYCNWDQVLEKKFAPKAFDPYKRFRAPFPRIAQDLRGMNIHCVNATPGSALTEFPIVDPEEVYPATPGVTERQGEAVAAPAASVAPGESEPAQGLKAGSVGTSDSLGGRW